MHAREQGDHSGNDQTNPAAPKSVGSLCRPLAAVGDMFLDDS
jgi:hypothetical protein